MQDLGDAPSVADHLLAGDPVAADHALVAWATTLGRLHARSHPEQGATRLAFVEAVRAVTGVGSPDSFHLGVSGGLDVATRDWATNAEILPSLGRNLGSCRGAATCNGNVTVELLPPNSVFEPRLQQVDLRFSRLFQFGTRKLRGDVDIYNLLNASNVLNMNTTYSPPGGVWKDVTQILGGRLVRLGFQMEF